VLTAQEWNCPLIFVKEDFAKITLALQLHQFCFQGRLGMKSKTWSTTTEECTMTFLDTSGELS